MKLLSSMAPRGLLAAAVAEFRRHHRMAIDAEAAGGVEVARRIAAGEAPDVVVLSADAIDELIGQGHLARASRRDLMTSGIAVAVRSGTAVPSLEDEAAVRAAILAAPSIGYSTGPSGRYLESLLERWGLLATLRARIVVPPPGVAVASLVGAGSVALGFQQLSEMLDVPGIDVAGSLPASLQHLTRFAGAVSTMARQAADAEEFLRYLASPQRLALKRQYGMAAP